MILLLRSSKCFWRGKPTWCQRTQHYSPQELSVTYQRFTTQLLQFSQLLPQIPAKHNEVHGMANDFQMIMKSERMSWTFDWFPLKDNYNSFCKHPKTFDSLRAETLTGWAAAVTQNASRWWCAEPGLCSTKGTHFSVSESNENIRIPLGSTRIVSSGRRYTRWIQAKPK